MAACLIAGCCHPVPRDRCTVLVTPVFGAAIGFIAACVDWMVLCSGLLCVRFCGAGRGKSVSCVFSCSPGTVGHSAGAGWLDFSWVWVRPGKSPVRCWTGKSDGIGPVSFPAPLVLRLGLVRRTGRWSLVEAVWDVLQCWKNPTESNKISNRTKLRTGQVEASKASRMFRAPMTSTPSHLEAERFFRPW